MTTDSAKPTLVCLRVPAGDAPLYFFDDQYGACSLCGHRIRFRPYHASIETKICVECVQRAAEGHTIASVGLTPQAEAELKEHLERRRS